MVTQLTQDTFQKEVLEQKKGLVLVDFYAVWCGPCKVTEPIIEELAEEMKDVKFAKLDVDTAPELSSEYQVFSIPTFLIFKDGKLIGQMVGAKPKESFIEEIDKAKAHVA